MDKKEQDKIAVGNKSKCHTHCHHVCHLHNHAHYHAQTENLRGKKLLWVTLLNFSISMVQVVGGILSNSLLLISDAIHNLGDTSAIFIAFIAGSHASKKLNAQKIFGYKRSEILLALFNVMVLIAICIFLFVDAYKRFNNKADVPIPVFREIDENILTNKRRMRNDNT